MIYRYTTYISVSVSLEIDRICIGENPHTCNSIIIGIGMNPQSGTCESVVFGLEALSSRQELIIFVKPLAGGIPMLLCQWVGLLI